MDFDLLFQVTQYSIFVPPMQPNSDVHDEKKKKGLSCPSINVVPLILFRVMGKKATVISGLMPRLHSMGNYERKSVDAKQNKIQK